MKSGARIGLAVGFGYLLGRRRKLRTALTLAAAVAAGRASREPGGLLKAGGNLLQSSPHLSNLGRLGGPLAAASKAAATAAAGSGIDAISGKLRGSADALRRKGGTGAGGAGDRPDRDTDAEHQERDDGGQDRDDDGGQERDDDGGRDRDDDDKQRNRDAGDQRRGR
ncbi:hypothetical protein F6X68_14275 [Micromonospora sp. AMSO12t]|uniref:hypothetical protein n=1 Tax=Micromonospora sp. AMSO12t TaxID=2650410 RepID=UPI00124B89DC|nr:hypothetical protein [Micromonospora sp. AMSO12t]KAB1153410.1 hypothetical protein F6X68_14275 [Micromonospora sp. AMSO12t]